MKAKLDTSLVIGDATYPVNGQLASGIGTKVYEIASE
jgi:hypothetical protein